MNDHLLAYGKFQSRGLRRYRHTNSTRSVALEQMALPCCRGISDCVAAGWSRGQSGRNVGRRSQESCDARIYGRSTRSEFLLLLRLRGPRRTHFRLFSGSLWPTEALHLDLVALRLRHCCDRLSWNLFSFTIFRILTGAGIGGEYAAINSAVDEIVPARLRGRLDLLINGTFWIGIIFGSLISTFFLRQDVFGNLLGWRMAFFSGVPIGVLVLWMRRYIPESPRWLISHGQSALAEDIVLGVEREIYDTRQAPESPAQFIQIRTNHEPLFRRMRKVFTSRSYRSRALLCLGLMAAQAFFYNSVFFSLGLVLLRYYNVPAERIGFYFLPIAVANFLGPVMLGTLFDIVGRKTMVAGTYCASAAALLVSSWLFSDGWLTLHSQILWWSLTFFFASTAASSAYLTVSEVFPQEIRASSIAFFYGFGTLAGGVAGPLIFGRLIGSGSRQYLFHGYAIGASLMFAAGIAQALWGVAAEQRSLEALHTNDPNFDKSRSASSSFRLRSASHKSHV